MSFSTLLMPLGLYTPFVDGLGNLEMGIIVPAGIGAVVTVICLARAVDALFDHYYPYAFHAIIGIVIAATIMIIPVDRVNCNIYDYSIKRTFRSFGGSYVIILFPLHE
ncbi:undecaprenyl phosphate translocase family protein, partial [Holdemania filiformis]|uniref:undecaprenyl phosphate translocase family protein n=1 Tax=Holdemania filiformis TaxID=61171 RepID=UPI00242D09EF